MANGGTITESLWRDLIADEVEDFVSNHISGPIEESELVEFIRTGNKKENN